VFILSEKMQNSGSYRNHFSRCKKNPNRVFQNGMLGRKSWNKGLTKETDQRVRKNVETFLKNYKEGKIKKSSGKASTPEKEMLRCQKISISTKKLQAEGKLHNIGYNRCRGIESYPEKFFKLVIKNEFIDKKYEFNMQFHRFQLDFAWFHKKKVIEIDGAQHERKKQRQRDINKDKLLNKEGWSILRIAWKDMFHDTRKWIKIAKDFIDL